MKPFGLLGTAVLFSILGMTATVAAQQDDRDKPAQAPAHEDQAAPPQENRTPDAKPAQPDEKRGQQQDEKRTQPDDKQVQDQEKRESKENKQVQDQEKREPKNDKQVQDQEKQQPRDDNRAQQDRNHPQMKQDQDAHRGAGNGGGRIPDDKFRSHFGRDHHFHVSRPAVVSGQPRFEYGGFSFIMVDPWPVGWDYADDCYIDYVGGEYLLFDLAHPGVSIVVNVVL
jgi:hypothetical protein